MKTMIAFACSFVAALVVGAMTPARALPASQSTEPLFCPPTVYYCCDRMSEGTLDYCAARGGTCGTVCTCCIPF